MQVMYRIALIIFTRGNKSFSLFVTLQKRILYNNCITNEMYFNRLDKTSRNLDKQDIAKCTIKCAFNLIKY